MCQVRPPAQLAFAWQTRGAPLRWLSLGRSHTTRACDPRAPRRNGFGRSMRMKSHRTSGGALPFAAVPWYDVPGTATRTAGFRVANARLCHCACYLLGGGALRALAALARRAAMGLFGPRAMKKPLHQRGGLSYSLQYRGTMCQVPLRLNPLRRNPLRLNHFGLTHFGLSHFGLTHFGLTHFVFFGWLPRLNPLRLNSLRLNLLRLNPLRFLVGCLGLNHFGLTHFGLTRFGLNPLRLNPLRLNQLCPTAP